MVRIFCGLAAFAVLLLITNLVLGLMAGDFNGVAGQYRIAQMELQEFEKKSSTSDSDLRDREAALGVLGERLIELQKLNNLHLLLGIAASLVTLLVNSVTVTYFIGTARWCQEVVETYGLDNEYVQRSRSLKRRSFPWALAGILSVIAMIFFGGAALPFGANAANSSAWVTPHLWVAILGTFVVGWSFLIQAGKIGANYQVINEVMREVQVVRQQQALN